MPEDLAMLYMARYKKANIGYGYRQEYLCVNTGFEHDAYECKHEGEYCHIYPEWGCRESRT